ncbi:unnamed protein product [Rangifer tarandus platyrhynchus]|uniref:Uncharacterized protein n=1 Tax=Rangifer tarandus platyrhynchus TaxID=3082113 RepID=A0ABN8Z589_RANTA|nr:unnamed protein product [Rangifer tarandus platyrhynchus]
MFSGVKCIHVAVNTSPLSISRRMIKSHCRKIFRSLRLLTQAHPAKADENLALFQRRFCWFRERVAKIQLRRHLLEAPRRCKELAGEGGDRLQVNVPPFAQRRL